MRALLFEIRIPNPEGRSCIAHLERWIVDRLTEGDIGVRFAVELLVEADVRGDIGAKVAVMLKARAEL